VEWFSTDDALIAEILAAGKRAGEPGWPLPLWDEYKGSSNPTSQTSRIQVGRPRGRVTAAMFLRNSPRATTGRTWTSLAPHTLRPTSLRSPKDRRECQRVLLSSSFGGELTETAIMALVQPARLGLAAGRFFTRPPLPPVLRSRRPPIALCRFRPSRKRTRPR